MSISDGILVSPQLKPTGDEGAAHRQAFISGFQRLAPRFRSAQKDLLDWLADAHAALGRADRERIGAFFARLSGAADHIAFRGHELPDFTHRSRDQMKLFSPKGSNVTEKTQFFDEAVASAFERFYPEGTPAPEAIVHVTCTGYSAPSGAQKLVSSRGWGAADASAACLSHGLLRRTSGPEDCLRPDDFPVPLRSIH